VDGNALPIDQPAGTLDDERIERSRKAPFSRATSDFDCERLCDVLHQDLLAVGKCLMINNVVDFRHHRSGPACERPLSEVDAEIEVEP